MGGGASSNLGNAQKKGCFFSGMASLRRIMDRRRGRKGHKREGDNGKEGQAWTRGDKREGGRS